MENEIRDILEKVTKLFLKYGIKSVSMDEIAAELCISKKTLYQHFKDKEDLIQTIISTETSKKKTQFSCYSDKGLNAIEEAIEVYVAANNFLKETSPVVEYDLRKYYPRLHKQMSDFRRETIRKTITENLKKGVEQGLYRNDFDLEIIAKIHVGRVELMMSDEQFAEEQMSKKMFNELFIYHLRGICSRKGLDFLEEKLDKLKSK